MHISLLYRFCNNRSTSFHYCRHIFNLHWIFHYVRIFVNTNLTLLYKYILHFLNYAIVFKNKHWTLSSPISKKNHEFKKKTKGKMKRIKKGETKRNVGIVLLVCSVNQYQGVSFFFWELSRGLVFEPCCALVFCF